MRILIACTHLPPIAGGAERVAWETAVRLAKSHEIHILTTGDEGKEEKSGVVIHRIQKKKPLIVYYSTLGRSKIKGIFRGMDFDIMHCHMAGPWGFVLPPLVKHRKLVITCHGGGVHPATFKSMLFTKPILKKANAVTCVSKWMQKYVKEKYGVKSVYIPNGVDARFRPMRVKRERNSIMYVGRLMEKKGIRELLEAARSLPEFTFEFAGKGALSPEINLKNTKYLGFVPDEQVPVLYNRAMAAVFPSHYEPFGIVGLEAMACGCPVIATRCGGFPEFIEDGKSGLLIKPESKEAIAKAIRLLSKDAALRKKISRNALKVSKDYSWDKVTGEYEEVYSTCLKR
jgi:glycosyltransferase involved in cell wall biosynthesis